MNKKNLIFGMIFLFVAFFAQAQETDFDIAYDAYAEGDYEKSILYYTLYLEEFESVNALYNRALAYYDLGQYEDAIIDYDAVIALDSLDAESYYSRGLTYYDMGYYEQAIKDNKTAIRLNNKYENAYTNLGLCYDALGDYEQAIEEYTHAIDLDPYSATDFYNRGLANQDLGNYEQAESDYSEAIYLDDTDVDYWWGRANLYYDMSLVESDYEQYLWNCIDDYYEAIYIDNSIASLYYNRGIAYYDLGLYEESLYDFEEAEYLDDEDIDIKWYIVLCAKETGDSEKALTYYETVERMDSRYEYLSTLDKNELSAKGFFDGLFDFNMDSLDSNNTFLMGVLGVLILLALILLFKLFGRKNEEVRKRM